MFITLTLIKCVCVHVCACVCMRMWCLHVMCLFYNNVIE